MWNAALTLDGKELIAVALPSYPIRAIETSRRLDGEDGELWSETVDFYAAALSKPPSELAASGGGFDMYADGETLTYVKENCDEYDTRGRFFLSVFPADPADLLQDARDAGREHESLNFDFDRYGAIVGGGCVIIRILPDYPINRIETGQWIQGEGELWRATVDFYAEEPSDPPSPLAASASGFDMWLDGETLTYVKENCDDEDARGRFFLSIFPADPSDLSQYARDSGREHEALNFDFDRYGAIVGGGCVIIRILPDYPINRIETGQWIAGEGHLWSAEIAVGD